MDFKNFEKAHSSDEKDRNLEKKPQEYTEKPKASNLEKAQKTREHLEEIDFEDIDSVVTSKGSVYNYLPDGKTQRYKKVEDKLKSPQKALVYIPNWNWVKENATSEDFLSQLGENPEKYKQTLLEYVHGEGKTYIVDKNGSKLETNQQIKDVNGPIYLAFGDEDSIDFLVPVSHIPRIGFMTYDTNKYKDEKTGEWIRVKHIGNKVIKINKKEK